MRLLADLAAQNSRLWVPLGPGIRVSEVSCTPSQGVCEPEAVVVLLGTVHSMAVFDNQAEL
jgi:hypothetical protein